MSNSNLLYVMMRARSREIEARAERLGPLLAELGAVAAAPATEPVTMRMARPADHEALRRLADLDSAGAVPPEPLLIGERGGRPVAARSLYDASVVADPFVPTSDVLALLALRARQLDAAGPSPRAPRRRLAAWRALRAGDA
jgi:hypothetical protein